MIGLLFLAIAISGASFTLPALMVLQRRHLRPSELPGLLCILLAGKSFRVRLAGILAIRRRSPAGSLRVHALERECGIAPASALEERVAGLAEVMRAASWSMGAMPQPAVMVCDQCGVPMPHGPRAGIGSTNTVHFTGTPVMSTTVWAGGGGGSSGASGPSWKFCSTECREQWKQAN